MDLKKKLGEWNSSINYYFIKVKKAIRKSRSKHRKKDTKEKRRHSVILKDYLLQAGYDFIDERALTRKVLRIVIGALIFFTIGTLIYLFATGVSLLSIPLFLFSIWTAVFGLLLTIAWLFIYVYLDVKIYQRTHQVEEVLPDFLQLTSANISAGMPIDQALWFAVRPKFGVLAKEIEEVAKSTIAGADLEMALKHFAKKYNSPLLKRSVNLIIEGMKAGGELADLLSKIAIDIQETKLMRKEIAASVMTYVIFISFASVAAAPFLFALSTQLLDIVQNIMGGLDISAGSGGNFNINTEGGGMDIGDFKIFSVMALTVSSIFSASIVSVIQKGSVREGLKTIPIFMIISLILYFVANKIVGAMMGSFI